MNKHLRATRPALALALTAATMLAPVTAHAQAPDDRAREAKIACASGDVARGVRLLAELYATTNHPSWVFNQGRCYQQNGRREDAIERFREYLRRGDPTAIQQRTEAETFIKELEAEIRARQAAAAAPITVPPPVATTPASPAPEPEPALPPTAPTAEPTLSDAAQVESPDRTRQTLLITSAALAGASVAALATGIVFSAKVKQVDNDIAKPRGEGELTYETWQDLLDRGNRYQTWQWIGYGTAAATLIASGTLFYFAQARPSVAATPAAKKVALLPVLTPDTAGASLHLRF